MTNPLTIIPGVGKSIANDLQEIGIISVDDLKGKDPEKLKWWKWKDKSISYN